MNLPVAILFFVGLAQRRRNSAQCDDSEGRSRRHGVGRPRERHEARSRGDVLDQQGKMGETTKEEK